MAVNEVKSEAGLLSMFLTCSQITAINYLLSIYPR